MERSRDREYWHTWAMRALLILGASHLLAGVGFFFAYNWDDLTPFTKFGLLQGGILVSVAVALQQRLDTPIGQGMLIAASAFTGILLAVIGQVYQTGADAWELFATWAVLILPWVVASRSSLHCLFWMLLCVTAFGFYGEQVLVALGRLDRLELTTVVGILPIAFLAARELAVRSGLRWLDDDGMRRVLVGLGLSTLFVPALAYIFSFDSTVVGLLAFVFVSIGLIAVYKQILPDFSVVAITTGFATLTSMAIGGRIIGETISYDGAGQLVLGLFLLGAWCVFLTTMCVRFLNVTHARLAAEAGDD